MGFTTSLFLFLFFPLCVGGYYLILWGQRTVPLLRRCRLADVFLLLAGLAFYGCALLRNVWLLLGLVLAVYLLGWLLQRCRRSGLVLAVGVALLLAALFLYKYYGFAAEALEAVAGGSVLPELSLAVPLGISFITFSAISYLADIYHGRATAGNLMDAALYLTFFPKVISGPIVKWQEFAPQLRQRQVSTERFVSGLNRIMIGFGKKLILADSFGAICSTIPNEGIDVPTAWLCAILYALQIYYDFAGYSDIAIGLSRLFGFQVAENFRFPYLATSITDFWRRWHISLGAWFREYLYIPLGGSRRGKARTLLNLAIVFFLTGVWHGSGLAYIAWGILHGTFRLLEKCLEGKKLYEKTPVAVKYLITMLVVVIGWEAFRLEGLRTTGRFVAVMLGLTRWEWLQYSFAYFCNARTMTLLLIGLVGATLPAWKPLRTLPEKLQRSRWGFWVQELALLALLAVSVLFMVNSTYSPFIYFQY